MTSEQPGARLGYIPAIDGLRAVAVLSVIVYHLWPAALPGGFTGVDIFFVISGFVVTGSALGKHFETRRSLLGWFYARRLMRIMPALIVMLLVTVVATQLFIPPAWLSNALPQTAASAFVGLSNVVLATKSDTYFGPQAGYNPFTHTWSLGVEEQFYLAFPFILYWHQRVASSGRAVRLVAWLSAASAALYVGLGLLAPKLAFYLIVTRFWELGAGMLLCLTLDVWRPRLAALSPARRGILTAGSLLLVALGLASRGSLFGMMHVPLPVLGTVGVIALILTDEAGVLARVLASRPMVTIGRLSYSLYLWHWPVFVLFHWTVGLDTWPLAVAALAIAALLATLSYRLVEKPLRRSPRIAAWPRRRVVGSVAAAALASAALTIAAFVFQPWLSLSVTRDHLAWYAESGRALDPANTRCTVVRSANWFHGGTRSMTETRDCTMKSQDIRIFAPANSHGSALHPALDQLAAERGLSVYSYFRSGCPYLPLIHPMRWNRGCETYFAAILADLRALARPGDIVFLPGLRVTRLANQFENDPAVLNWHGDRVSPEAVAEARALLDQFAALHLRVVLEAPEPVFPSPPFRCSDWFNRNNPVCRPGLTVSRRSLLSRRSNALQAEYALAAGHPEITVWDPFPILCAADPCSPFQDGRPLFFDGDHLSGHGNEMIYPSLRAVLLSAATSPVR